MSGADVMSYGGGHQTAAMCVLVAQGKLPRPERIVMADTGREPDGVHTGTQPELTQVRE